MNGCTETIHDTVRYITPEHANTGASDIIAILMREEPDKVVDDAKAPGRISLAVSDKVRILE